MKSEPNILKEGKIEIDYTFYVVNTAYGSEDAVVPNPPYLTYVSLDKVVKAFKEKGVLSKHETGDNVHNQMYSFAHEWHDMLLDIRLKDYYNKKIDDPIKTGITNARIPFVQGPYFQEKGIECKVFFVGNSYKEGRIIQDVEDTVRDLYPFNTYLHQLAKAKTRSERERLNRRIGEMNERLRAKTADLKKIQTTSPSIFGRNYT